MSSQLHQQRHPFQGSCEITESRHASPAPTRNANPFPSFAFPPTRMHDPSPLLSGNHDVQPANARASGNQPGRCGDAMIAATGFRRRKRSKKEKEGKKKKEKKKEQIRKEKHRHRPFPPSYDKTHRYSRPHIGIQRRLHKLLLSASEPLNFPSFFFFSFSFSSSFSFHPVSSAHSPFPLKTTPPVATAEGFRPDDGFGFTH